MNVCNLSRNLYAFASFFRVFIEIVLHKIKGNIFVGVEPLLAALSLYKFGQFGRLAGETKTKGRPEDTGSLYISVDLKDLELDDWNRQSYSIENRRLLFT